MESGRLWASVARHWLLASVVFVLVLGAAVAAAFLPKQSYESTATFGLVPTVSDTQASGIPQTQLAQALVGNFLAQINSQTTEAVVRKGLTGPAATVNWSATGENQPGTLVLRVHVTSQDDAVVADVANAYSQLIRQAPSTPTGIGFVVIDQARKPSSAVSPNRALILGAGGVLALVLAACAALLAGTKPKQRRGTKPPRATAAAPAVVPQVSTPVEQRTAEPIRG
jgi:uncharacterized protein involved in exopolysaccharide biosynthesis